MPTDTPTVEQMVRKIAEWMGYKELHISKVRNWSSDGLLVWQNAFSHMFKPHTLDGAADRERVMLAMEWNVMFMCWRQTGGKYEVRVHGGGTFTGVADTYGLAFVTAVYQWIVSQEKIDGN